MDLAYPIGSYSSSGPNPLRWSLRTMAQHSTIDRVFIAGAELPEWIDTASVTFLEVPLADDKREHSGRNLEAILSSEISSRFLWMNDDFFLLEDREVWPVWGVGTLRAKIEELEKRKGRASIGGRLYVDGLRDQLELLEEWGFTDPPLLDIHVPIPLEKPILEPIRKRARAARPELEAGFFRSLYAASELPIEELENDPKIYHYHEPIPRGAGIVSTSPISWNVGRVGKQIRQQYWRPSPWEIQK